MVVFGKTFYYSLAFVTFCFILLKEVLSEEDEIFVPTNEWKQVKKGQKIPQGLHVRMNLETGITEAKLLDPNESSKSNTAPVLVPSETSAIEGLNLDEIKQKYEYRKYETIKEELSKLNLMTSTEFEQIDKLFENYDKNNVMLNVLEDMEYLSHQYDNAMWFVKKQVFETVIYPNLNSSDVEVKSQSLVLMGSLLQNHESVKITALKSGALTKLLNILQHDKNMVIKQRAMYALSALIRRLPYAQISFIQNGGLVILQEILQDKDLLLSVRVATLFTDLIDELEESKKFENADAESKSRAEQYAAINITDKLIKLGYCEILKKLMINVISSGITDEGTVGKGVEALAAVQNECEETFKSSAFIGLLNKLKQNNYEQVTFSLDKLMNVREDL